MRRNDRRVQNAERVLVLQQRVTLVIVRAPVLLQVDHLFTLAEHVLHGVDRLVEERPQNVQPMVAGQGPLPGARLVHVPRKYVL